MRNGTKIRIESYREAEKILARYSTNELYLRSLVAYVTENDRLADELDFNELRHFGHKILGAAKRMLRTRQERVSAESPLEEKSREEQLVLFR